MFTIISLVARYLPPYKVISTLLTIFLMWFIPSLWLIYFITGSLYLFSSVQFSHSVVSNYLQLHGLQHTRFLCPLPVLGVYSNSCLLSWYLLMLFNIFPTPPHSPLVTTHLFSISVYQFSFCFVCFVF